MPQCVTCGCELHPERALKFNYCMARECQDKNAKGLTMVAVGVNKAAEQYLILDERTSEELASGKYHDQRRGAFRPPTPPGGPGGGRLRPDPLGGGAGAVTGRSGAAAPARRQDPPAVRPARRSGLPGAPGRTTGAVDGCREVCVPGPVARSGQTKLVEPALTA